VLLTIDGQLVAKGKCLLREESWAASGRSLAGSIFLSKKAQGKQISGKPGGKYAQGILSIADVACIFQVQYINQIFR
jgi:hypothetical protein